MRGRPPQSSTHDRYKRHHVAEPIGGPHQDLPPRGAGPTAFRVVRKDVLNLARQKYPSSISTGRFQRPVARPRYSVSPLCGWRGNATLEVIHQFAQSQSPQRRIVCPTVLIGQDHIAQSCRCIARRERLRFAKSSTPSVEKSRALPESDQLLVQTGWCNRWLSRAFISSRARLPCWDPAVRHPMVTGK